MHGCADSFPIETKLQVQPELKNPRAPNKEIMYGKNFFYGRSPPLESRSAKLRRNVASRHRRLSPPSALRFPIGRLSDSVSRS